MAGSRRTLICFGFEIEYWVKGDETTWDYTRVCMDHAERIPEDYAQEELEPYNRGGFKCGIKGCSHDAVMYFDMDTINGEIPEN